MTRRPMVLSLLVPSQAGADFSWARVGPYLGGPLLTLGVAALLEGLSPTAWRIPDPPALLLPAVLLSVLTGGLRSGLVSTVLAWLYLAYDLYAPGRPFAYTGDDLRRLLVWGGALPTVALLAARLKRRAEQLAEAAARRERYAASLVASFSERKQVESELRRVRQELQSSMKALEVRNREAAVFIHALSHDLQAPLVSIQGFAAQMARSFDAALGEEGHFYLERLRANADYLESLIHGLLDLTRVEPADTPPEVIDLASFLPSVLGPLHEPIAAQGIEVRTSAECPAVTAHPAKLRQVLAHLLANAVHYIGNPDHPCIDIHCQDGGDHWLFCVRDNGIGIPRAYHGRIFQPFERLAEARLVHPRGTGLGLAIVRKVVESQGGAVRVESAPGQGSAFYFTVPKPDDQ